MAIIYERETKRGISYTLQWSVNGKRHRKSIGVVSKKEADLAKNTKERELIEGAIESVNVPTFGKYAVEYLDYYRYHYPNSYSRIKQLVDSHLVPFFGLRALNIIKRVDAEEYQVMRAKSALPQSASDRANDVIRYPRESTINKEIRTLKTILNRAATHEIITVNPLNGLKALRELDSKAPSFFTKDELSRIYEASPHKAHFCKLLATTGMRSSEARNLKWSNVTDKLIMVESTGQKQNIGEASTGRTKSGKWRPVPLNSHARDALLTFWQIESKDRSATTIPTHDGLIIPLMNRRSFTRVITDAVTKAGLTGSAHKFRHTCFSLMAMAGVPIYTIQKIAGHSTIAVTEKYAHLNDHYYENIRDDIFDA